MSNATVPGQWIGGSIAVYHPIGYHTAGLWPGRLRFGAFLRTPYYPTVEHRPQFEGQT
jgi:hypothetical protein